MPSEVLNIVLVTGAIIGGVSYAFAQWFSSRRKGASDALHLALEEMSVIRLRVERLEKENVALQAELHELKKENTTLRALLTDRDAQAIHSVDKLEDALRKQTRRLVEVIREGRQAPAEEAE